MSNLASVEIKAFVPSKCFSTSCQFYSDIGFTKASEGGGVAYFHHGKCSFLLQDFYEKALAENLMMHLLVEDADAWHAHIIDAGVAEKYGIQVGELIDQPWKMRDFVLQDPCGVLWRIGQNIE